MRDFDFDLDRIRIRRQIAFMHRLAVAWIAVCATGVLAVIAILIFAAFKASTASPEEMAAKAGRVAAAFEKARDQ
ncbi:hypothetical protein [Caulobacter sp. RL271]|uniref:Uncharacterized protein n=1 Tax=Caulobacter segnis TaxID=88688 RepID=A0ABY4ZWR6_9CAUL|nr:hypothetical protein [Caulobacter segnis]USQ97277.1 hypothetical protein MZV50_06960 [Caulobacter segnis]